MRKLALLVFITIFVSQFVAAQKGMIDVNVYNIKEPKGYLHIALYNQQKGFPHKEGVLKTYVVAVKSNRCNYTIKNLAKGDYAVVVYHDKNSDGKCNRFLGIPSESYGFSNNIRPKFSAPGFKECKFNLKGKESIFIKLK